MKYMVEFKTLNNEKVHVTLATDIKHFSCLSFQLYQIDSFEKKSAAGFNFWMKELA